MTKPGSPVPAAAPASSPPAAAAEPPTAVLLVVVLGWLITLVKITVALPALVGASMLAGAAAALSTTSMLNAHRPAWPSVVRYALGVLAAGGVGGIAGAGVLALRGSGGPGWVLAASVAIAALLGGGMVPLVPGAVAAAGVAAGLGAFVVGYGIDFFLRDQLLNLFGAGSSPAADYAAGGYLALTEATASALVAGLVAYGHLRHAGRPRRWSEYLLAGATPGVVLLLTAAVTRIADARLMALLGSVSGLDRTALGASAQSRVNYALVVLFLGAIVTLLAYGRSLPKHTDVAEDDKAAGTPTIEQDDELSKTTGTDEDGRPA